MAGEPRNNDNIREFLVKALKGVDTQIAREMQRTPVERELHGVQKWEPMRKRIESISVSLIDNFNDQTVNLEAILVLSSALTKALSLIVQDLGVEGLGKIRVNYCRDLFEQIERDITHAETSLHVGTDELN